jgi:hypothetical protein
MLTESEKKKIIEAVLRSYREKYPNWTDTKVTDIVENKLFGILVSISSENYPDGEICIYRKSDGEVYIFDSTPQLLSHIDRKASGILTAKEVLSFVVVVWILGIFTGLVFYFRDDGAIALVTTAIAGILGTFAGVKINQSDSENG